MQYKAYSEVHELSLMLIGNLEGYLFKWWLHNIVVLNLEKMDAGMQKLPKFVAYN